MYCQVIINHKKNNKLDEYLYVPTEMLIVKKYMFYVKNKYLYSSIKIH